MLNELSIGLISGLMLIVVILIIFKVISCKLALVQFKRCSRGLPICPNASLLGNHAYSMLLGDRVCENLRKWHQEMGKTIGWLRGSNFCVSTVDLNLIKTIILGEPNSHLNRTHLHIPVAELEFCIATAPENEWQQLRKSIAPALTPTRFKAPNVVCEIEESIEKLISLIELRLDSEEPGNRQLFVIDDFVARYSANLVAKCFYKQDNLIDFKSPRDKYVHRIELVVAVLKTSLFVYLTAVFPVLRNLVDWLAHKFTTIGVGRRQIRKFVMAQTKSSLEARKQLSELKREAKEKGFKINPNDFQLKDGTRFRRNMIDYIIDQYLDGKLSKTQYLNNSIFFLAAGFRTAADCLVHTIYLLSINQQVQEKLRASIKRRGTNSNYLDWVLLEGLRLLPPAPIGCSRTISHDIQLSSGHLLPKGTFVLTNAYVIHRQKEFWGEDAEEFKPERWRNASQHHPMQFLAFGAGLKGCPGRHFAMFEMKMLLCALLTRYKFTGELRDDVYEFDTPLFMYVAPNSVSRVNICRI